MKILLTGATGFVGLNLLLTLLKREEITHVAVCVRHGGRLLALLAREGFCGLPEKVRVIEGDSGAWHVEQCQFVPDVCIHCAGVLFARKREDYFRGNVEGTRNLLATLPESTRTIVLSSQSAVGPTPQGAPPLAEEAPARPLSYYGQSKLAMEEMLARDFTGKLPLVVLRPPMVLGPRDSATLPLFQMMAAPVWCKPGLREKQFSWIGVQDLVDAILLVAQKHRFPACGTPQQTLPVYFVTSGETITDSRLIQSTAAVLGRKGVILPIPNALLRLVAFASRFIPAIGQAVPSLMPDRARELWEDRWLVSGDRFTSEFTWSAHQQLAGVLAEQGDFLKRHELL